jgi:tRNA1(Val) A37 N6-methylase TrmN6
MESTGLKRNAAYLVRPDGYIALVSADTSASALSSYLDRYKLKSAA